MDVIKMKKKILIGSIFAALLMLSMSAISNIQAYHVKELNSKLDDMDKSNSLGVYPGFVLCAIWCWVEGKVKNFDPNPLLILVTVALILSCLNIFTPLDFFKCNCNICAK